jgi:hypothetical protein
VQAGGPQFVTVEDSMSVVHRHQGGSRRRRRHLRSEPAIVAGLAQATPGERSRVDWAALAGDYDRIRDHIAGGPRLRGLQPRACASRAASCCRNPRDERRFETPTGRARFTCILPRIDDVPEGACC